MTIALRREVLQRLLQDPAWSARLDRVKTIPECEKLLLDFAREKGIKAIVLPQ